MQSTENTQVNNAVYYVTRIVERGTKAEHLITCAGPFNGLPAAKAKMYACQHVQPQFDFIIEREDSSGLVTVVL